MDVEAEGSLDDNFLLVGVVVVAVAVVSLLLTRMLRLVRDEKTTLELARGEWQLPRPVVPGRRITIIVVLLGPARTPTPLPLLSILC